MRELRVSGGTVCHERYPALSAQHHISDHLHFEETDDRTWMVLYWIAILFTSVNAVAREFSAGIKKAGNIISIPLASLAYHPGKKDGTMQWSW